jgi:predicted GIY-YIG superfamily endonuclease
VIKLSKYVCAMSARLYSAYIVASQSRTLYIGVTGDLCSSQHLVGLR